jgi:hypothetical protein
VLTLLALDFNDAPEVCTESGLAPSSSLGKEVEFIGKAPHNAKRLLD